MPIPVIVNNFATFYSHAKARQKLEEVSSKLKGLPNRAVALHFQTEGLRVKKRLHFDILNLNINGKRLK